MISLGDATRAYMRRAAESLMTDTCTIEQLSETSGPAGEQINAWATVQTGVKCRMIQIGKQFSNTQNTLGDQAIFNERYRLVVPYGTTIAEQYRITLASDSSAWLVLGLITSQTDEVSTQVIVTRDEPA